jgi:hypothetical protein
MITLISYKHALDKGDLLHVRFGLVGTRMDNTTKIFRPEGFTPPRKTTPPTAAQQDGEAPVMKL